MERRTFLKIGAAGLVGSMVPHQVAKCGFNTPVYAGWEPNVDFKLLERPYLYEQAPTALFGSGKDRIVLLFKYLERSVGKIIPHNQGIGDCVGQGYALGIDLLGATQIYGLGLPEKWVAKASPEALYAGSRYEIGYKLHGNKRLLSHDGSVGSYCVQYSRDFGVLFRKKYGEVDLTHYSAELSKVWGKKGVPDSLADVSKQHPIQSYALVQSYEDCRDAICNGYPVIFCSNVGFNPNCRRHNPNGRDSQGFLKKCGTWYHCMTGSAVDDTKRPGILLHNSWGQNWVQGPTRLNQPQGSFWVDAKTIDIMCEQGDSYAISRFVGFPSAKLDYNLF